MDQGWEGGGTPLSNFIGDWLIGSQLKPGFFIWSEVYNKYIEKLSLVRLVWGKVQ